jgi:hypothetical protein
MVERRMTLLQEDDVKRPKMSWRAWSRRSTSKKTAPAWALAFAAALMTWAGGARAEPPRPPKPGHPIIGTWSLDVPGTDCEETYFMRQDGTTLVTSGEETGQSAYEIDDEPGPDGFYKSTDRVTKDNGRPDCSGGVTKVGAQVVLYIKFHPSGDMMVMCKGPSLEACIGPFYRVGGEGS